MSFRGSCRHNLIYVLQNYTQKGQGNSKILGCFEQRGHNFLVGNASVGFRGWSGGYRDNFIISPVSATPGYTPGPNEPGNEVASKKIASFADLSIIYRKFNFNIAYCCRPTN